MEKLSKSSSKSALQRPFIEEDEVLRWAAGLRSCAKMCRDSADKMRKGIWPGNWKAEVGMARLLEKMAETTDPRKKHAGSTIQKHPKQGEAVETCRRISDGKKSNIPRKALVV